MKLGIKHKNAVASLQWLKMCFDCVDHSEDETFDEWLDKQFSKHQ